MSHGVQFSRGHSIYVGTGVPCLRALEAEVDSAEAVSGTQLHEGVRRGGFWLWKKEGGHKRSFEAAVRMALEGKARVQRRHLEAEPALWCFTGRSCPEICGRSWPCQARLALACKDINARLRRC
jgi:hypothetical protein